MRLTRTLGWLLALTLLTICCASPQQRAMKLALRDYRRAGAASAAYARQQLNRLAAAAKAFHATHNRWPATLMELGRFAALHGLDFDPFAFNAVTLAVLPDGSLQAHYDVNCSAYDTPQYKFAQTGSINIRLR